MKIQLENYGFTYTIETKNEDIDIKEYFEIFKGLLIQATFSEKQFNNTIIEMAEEIKEYDNN
jgi:hypothetical protein